MKILLIDDDPFALKLLAYQLAGMGYGGMISLDNAHEALALLENDIGSFGLIFCDLQMPQMDGVEFVRHLVRLNFAGDLVLVSGEEERILQTALRLAEAHGLNVLGALHKPVSPDRLEQILKNRATPKHDAALHRPALKIYDPDALRRAIAIGELVNYYQPKVEFATGAVVGLETLVRWRHPTDGLVFPDRFIAMAEEHDLINDLTRVVLTNAISQIRLWQDANLQVQVAVNISMADLIDLQFPEFIEYAANQAGISLVNLVLEVTETQLMKNPRVALDILTRLRLKHIGLSIDDFGIGHSSLAQLRDIPFSELKVDQGFVHEAWRDTCRLAIVESSLGLARQLGMKTVAEGVEDQNDWNCLRAAGCDLAQGYFIAKPMTAAELTVWIEAWQVKLFASKAV